MAEESAFVSALEGMKHVKSENGEMLTKPFLDVCKILLLVLDKFGTAMSPVKADVGNNISRLDDKYLTNPSEFKLLYSLIQPEIEAKTAKSSSSCTNALLWLTRAMDYLVEQFRNLEDNPLTVTGTVTVTVMATIIREEVVEALLLLLGLTICFAISPLAPSFLMSPLQVFFLKC